MSYDPCGTQHLDGEEILKRLAAYLGVEVVDLKSALLVTSINRHIARIEEEKNGSVSH